MAARSALSPSARATALTPPVDAEVAVGEPGELAAVLQHRVLARAFGVGEPRLRLAQRGGEALALERRA